MHPERHPPASAEPAARATARGLDRLLGPALLAALALLVAGLLMPAVSITFLYLIDMDYSLLDGIIGYFAEGTAYAWMLGLVCGLFTVVLPAGKILYGLAVWYVPTGRSTGARRWLAGLSALTKWSMLDVFVVAIMVFAVDGRIFTTADLSLGIVLFAAAVLLSSLCLQRLARIA